MRQRMHWMMSSTALVAALAVATGCSSMEDRIENVVEHERDECKQADDQFYEVTTQDGSTYEVLAELCHLEPSDAEMHTDWRGTVETGPLMWTAEENQDDSTVYLTRAAWPALDRARSAAGSDDPETLEEAEEHFAEAQSEYGDSSWVRLNRLENLLDLRDHERPDDPDELEGSLLGEDVEQLYREVVEWAESEDKPETADRARLAVVDHLSGYIGEQQSSIDSLGGQDSHYESIIEHERDEGNIEEAEKYEEKLEERRERRPEIKEQLQTRIRMGRLEGCDVLDELDAADVDDDRLGDRIEARADDFDCDNIDEDDDTDD